MKPFYLFRLIFLVLMIGMVSQIAQTQDPAHWQLTDEDGLPSMTVYQIAQDGNGYMWIGTSNGICRYDGKEFTIYSHRLMNDSEIIDIGIDKYNHVWFRNLSNQTFLIKNGEVIPINETTSEDLTTINDIFVMGDYIYMILQMKDVSDNPFRLIKYKIDKNGLLSEQFIFNKEFSSWRSMKKDKDYVYFPSRKINEDFYDWNRITITNENEIENLKPIENKLSSFQFHPSNQDQFLLYKLNAKKLLKLEKGELNEILELSERNSVTGIFKIQDRNFLLTKKGIIVEDDQQNFEEEKIIFKGKNCNKIIVDREKNYWIGTTGHGVIFIPSLELRTYNTNNSSLANDQVFSLDWDRENDDIYIGHNEAKISILNNEKISNYNFNSSGRVVDITRGEGNNLFLAIDSKSLLIQSINKNPQQFQVLKELVGGYKVVLIDSQNRIFAGTSKQVLLYESEDDLRKPSPNTRQILLSKRTYALAEDSKNRIWIGTTEGIYIYENEEVKQFSTEEKNKFNVSSLIEGNDKTMWVSTLGNGVIGYKNDKEVARYNSENGLASDNCKKIIIDGESLWIITNKGINILNQKTGKIELINKTDGLPSNDISDIILAENEVWIGSSKGLINFPKNLTHQNSITPNIHITSLKIWEKDTTLSSAYNLDYHQNNFQIEFVGLGFRSKGNITYQYKLSDVDKNWVTTNSRTVRYPTVEPGEYTFEVFAINEDGVKSEVPAKMSFSIATPWWKTWWFWTLMALAFFGSIGALFYWRLQRIREKEKLERSFSKKVNALEQKALQLQMNPHFIYNTLNAIQYFLTVNDSKFAMIYLSRFAKMIRMIFQQSKQSTITVEEEINFLKIYLDLEQLRFKDKVEVEFKVDEELKQRGFDLKIPPLLLQPLIENAFKHGLFQKEDKGIIKVDFKLENKFLLCNIEDDGVGREKAKEKDSWKPKDYVSSGINTTEDRLKILNDLSDSEEESAIEIIDLFDKNNIPCGTRVEVKIRCEE